jgi:hypothetical protein
VLAQLYDREPEKIRARSLYRDRAGGDDRVGILLDTFHDNESGRLFWTTPNGVRGDALVMGDGAGMDGNWNTFWDVATIRTSEGWFAEFRIPFSSLGFQTEGRQVRMGMILFRYIARKDETDVFPAISREHMFLRPSLAEEIILEGVETTRPAYLTPYVLTGKGRTAKLVPDGSAYDYQVDHPREIGADLRVHLTSNLTLDLSANTDFAQVEADDQQVNLTRFSLFFPEKRQFFQERSDIFFFSTGGRSRLFHSRHIGLDRGSPVPILGGARLVGRLGRWDLGFLSMQTESAQGLSSENFSVARVRRQILNPHSNAGAILVSRVRKGGRYNVAYGLDTQLRLAGDDYLTLRWAQTFDDQVQEERGFRFGESALVQLTAQRRRNEGFTYWISGRWAGEDYWPGTGFQDRRNFMELSYNLSYLRLMGEESRFRRIDPFQLFGYIILRNEDGGVESAQIEYDTDVIFNTGGSLWWDAEAYYEDLPHELPFPEDTYVPPGSYWFFRTEGGYNFPPGSLFRASVLGGFQEFYDGRLANIGIYPQWRASAHLELITSYEFVAVRFPERSQAFNSHLLGLRAQTALNTKVSVTAFLQLSSVADFAAANVRFRYNFREGQDLWLVYNEGWNTDRFEHEPTLPRTDNRTLLLKYTHTFAR